MKLAMCASKSLYKPLAGLINMIENTQTEIEDIYCFVQDDPELFTGFSDNIHFINVSKFEKAQTTFNSNNKWTYMTLIKCFFTELLPDVDKVLYLDIDIVLLGDLSPWYNMDMENYSIAGVLDTGVPQLCKSIITKDCPNYINTGVILMNLKYIREHKLDEQIIDLLNNYFLGLVDQDALNLVCKNSLKLMDCKWNSSPATTISENPVVYHTAHTPKPWDIESPCFPIWSRYYLNIDIESLREN